MSPRPAPTSSPEPALSSRFSAASLESRGGPDAARPALSALSGEPPPSVLVSLVKADLAYRFGRGERPGVTEYLERFPELKEASDQVLSLVYEEYCLLEEYGEAPDVSQFCRRYEPWKDSLQSQLGYHRALSQFSLGPPPAPVAYPNPGDRFKGFTLREILGQGGAARVFLAEEDEVGNRKVALKVSANKGLEPSILGKLDHANIVPVHSVVVHEESGLRGLCMPYRPGMTLDRVIRRIGPDRLPRPARSLMDALMPDGHGLALPLRDGERPGWADFPVGGTYADAVAWIALALANALSHAHKKGILHRDVKPANILLTFRDGPQLLDFNLAHDPNAATEAEAALRGGTLPYMAPEQLQAFLDPSQWGRVGAAADLYALGLVLRELLTGQSPDTPESRLPLPRAICNLRDRRATPATPIRSINPRVRPSLASIIETCLEFDPSDRYASADQLAEDLRRYLARRPLAHARNASTGERVANAARRHAPRIAAAVVVGGLAFGLFVAVRERNLAVEDSIARALLGRTTFQDPERKIADSPEFKEAWESFWLEGAVAAEARLRAMERKPELQSVSHVWTTLLRGLIARELGDESRAQYLLYAVTAQPGGQEALRAWTDRRETDSHGWFYRAVALTRKTTDLQTALAYYKKAVELDSSNKPAIRGVISTMQTLRLPLAEQLPYVELCIRLDEIQRRADPRFASPKQEVIGFHLTRALANSELAEGLIDRRRQGGVRAAIEGYLAKIDVDLGLIGQFLKSQDIFFLLEHSRLRSFRDFTTAMLLADDGNLTEADRLTSRCIERDAALLQKCSPSGDPDSPEVKLARLTERVVAWRAGLKLKPVTVPRSADQVMTFEQDQVTTPSP